MRDAIAATTRHRERLLPMPDAAEQIGQIIQPLCHDMNDIALALHAATAGEHAGGENNAALPVEQARPDDEVGDAGFVLEGDEDDARRRAGTLAYQHQAGNGETLAIACRQEIATGDDPLLRQIATKESHRMLAQRQADVA